MTLFDTEQIELGIAQILTTVTVPPNHAYM